jgi:hypothetical protein
MRPHAGWILGLFKRQKADYCSYRASDKFSAKEVTGASRTAESRIKIIAAKSGIPVNALVLAQTGERVV